MNEHLIAAQCARVLRALNAEGVVLVVLNGNRPAAFSVHAPPHMQAMLPETLEYVARDIRATQSPRAGDRGDGW